MAKWALSNAFEYRSSIFLKFSAILAAFYPRPLGIDTININKLSNYLLNYMSTNKSSRANYIIQGNISFVDGRKMVLL